MSTQLETGIKALMDEDLPQKFSRYDVIRVLHKQCGRWYSAASATMFIKKLMAEGLVERVVNGRRKENEPDLFAEVRTKKCSSGS